MSSLNSLYIKKETLETLLKVVTKKGEKGVELTVNINDESNQYGQNVSAFVSQTKEQREAKKDRFYVGNGKTFWTDGKIHVPAKPDSLPPSDIGGPGYSNNEDENDDDLPF